MTAAWLVKLAALTQQVAALTAERDAWATATTVQALRPVYPSTGCRTYNGTLAKSVISELAAATATDLAAAQAALTACMAGK